MNVDVVFALTGDVTRNSRALKQLRLLEGLGCRVAVLTMGVSAPDPELARRVEIVPLELPGGSGPRFFSEVHRRFKAAAGGIGASIYHASDLYALPAMARASRKRPGARLVYDARELYPFVTSTAGRPWVTLFWHAVEGRFIRKADAVFTVSESIAERLSVMYGIEHPPVLYNVPERRSIEKTDDLRRLLGIPPDRAVLLHQGQMQKSRGCESLVTAMVSIDSADLVFMGGGALRPKLEEEVLTLGLAHVHFIDAVPPATLLRVTASADIGLTLLEDTCLNHRFALPNKLFEYAMAGVPVVASDLPEIRRVVAGFGIGELVDASDPASIAAGIRIMLEDPQQRAECAGRTRLVIETFNWETASEAFTTTYRSLLSSDPL